MQSAEGGGGGGGVVGSSASLRAKMEKLTFATRDIMLRQKAENGTDVDVDAVMATLRSEGAAAEAAPLYQKTFAKEWVELDAALRAAEQAEADAGGAARLAALNAQTAA